MGSEPHAVPRLALRQRRLPVKRNVAAVCSTPAFRLVVSRLGSFGCRLCGLWMRAAAGVCLKSLRSWVFLGSTRGHQCTLSGLVARTSQQRGQEVFWRLERTSESVLVPTRRWSSSWRRYVAHQSTGAAVESKSTVGKAEENPAEAAETISVTFVDREGVRHAVRAPIGSSMLEVAHENHIDLEGACEGSLACSTCHVYVSEEHFRRLPEPTDDENDMLDLAFGLQENSRLGCQVIATKELDGMELTLPKATRNMAVDGYVPKPH
ncbi:probable adrenodoxin [Cyanidioschyzon merolae strain 10D]|uniref:Probable adrenodoxin n=1 Tax=Cyanidioschyzon merolae (strain NIES-3377 / 10D) TaxID=280699 RepID=M1V9G8_CYAM1|nr:probable adrenodoxin [Cyanidioschyzon merolae strain 10D]BAM81509.1 probable adrenodoxin [Cyanidioschyzon merolae strain 10D]|eukprot:XP_005537545.1 probable adrenodoxin [Cyanidioschyzon merolae strain 10D]